MLYPRGSDRGFNTAIRDLKKYLKRLIHLSLSSASSTSYRNIKHDIPDQSHFTTIYRPLRARTVRTVYVHMDIDSSGSKGTIYILFWILMIFQLQKSRLVLWIAHVNNFLQRVWQFVLLSSLHRVRKLSWASLSKYGSVIRKSGGN